MNNVLIHIITILIISFVSALIGIAFNRIQQPDMILAPYRKWLEYINNRKYKSFRFRWFEFKLWFTYNTTFNIVNKANLEYLMLHKDKWYNDSTKRACNKSKFINSLTKPLGLCIVCNTFWIGVIVSILFTKDINFLQLLIQSIIIGLSSIGFLIIVKDGQNSNSV